MLGTGSSLLQTTFKRLNAFIPSENIVILTNALYTEIILEQIPEIDESQLVLEPVMRNTAPCILLAALKIKKENPEAVMLVAPSDHWITEEDAFVEDVSYCFKQCEEKEILCTLGITPSFPNTGFGYIEYDNATLISDRFLYPVKQFREKPDYNTARSFLEQGNFLWNAGIFMWSVRSIVNSFESLQPEMFHLFNRHIGVLNTKEEVKFLENSYHEAENISIDFAILEGSENVYVLPANFGWNDLGTWGALHDKLSNARKENVTINGELLAEGSEGNILRLPQGKIAVIRGLNDFIVVDHGNVLLILPKEDEQEIKRIAGEVENIGKEH